MAKKWKRTRWRSIGDGSLDKSQVAMGDRPAWGDAGTWESQCLAATVVGKEATRRIMKTHMRHGEAKGSELSEHDIIPVYHTCIVYMSIKTVTHTHNIYIHTRICMHIPACLWFVAYHMHTIHTCIFVYCTLLHTFFHLSCRTAVLIENVGFCKPGWRWSSKGGGTFACWGSDPWQRLWDLNRSR